MEGYTTLQTKCIIKIFIINSNLFLTTCQDLIIYFPQLHKVMFASRKLLRRCTLKMATIQSTYAVSPDLTRFTCQKSRSSGRDFKTRASQVMLQPPPLVPPPLIQLLISMKSTGFFRHVQGASESPLCKDCERPTHV